MGDFSYVSLASIKSDIEAAFPAKIGDKYKALRLQSRYHIKTMGATSDT